MAAATQASELWQRALDARAKALAANLSFGVAARLALSELLIRAGYSIGVVEIHTWSRSQQGEAYLWALAKVEGRAEFGPPEWVKR